MSDAPAEKDEFHKVPNDVLDSYAVSPDMASNLHRQLDNVLNTKTSKNHPSMVEALRIMLKAKPEFVKPTTDLPIEEVDGRLDYARSIEKKIQRKLTRVELITIMMAPMPRLEIHGYLDFGQRRSEMEDAMNESVLLVYYYYDGKIAGIYEGSSPERPKAGTGEAIEKKACRKRDEVCIFTKAWPGDEAYIIPKSWNDTQDNATSTDTIIRGAQAFISAESYRQFGDLFCDQQTPGTTNKYWNMVYFEKQLHVYLNYGFVGLKCLGLELDDDNPTMSSVVIQFHWMNCVPATINPDDEMNLEGKENDFMAIVEELRGFEAARRPAVSVPGAGLFGAVRLDTHTPVLSGHITRLRMPTEDAEKCKAMLDLAWPLAVVAAMSGVAGSPNLPGDWAR